jgi:hypothetical protein
MRYIITFLLLASASYGQEITNDCMVQNRGPNCLWACVETAGRAKGILEVDGLLAERYQTYKAKGHSAVKATEPEVIKHLTKLGLKAKHIDVKDGIPKLSIVNLRAGAWVGSHCHAVLFIRQDEDTVTYYAPNSKVIATVDRGWFINSMDGTCLVIERGY